MKNTLRRSSRIDPAVQAIADHRRAWEAMETATTELGRIDDALPPYAELPRKPSEQVGEEAARRVTSILKMSGYSAAYERFQAACAAEAAALQRACTTVPTTVAGVTALARFIRDELVDNDIDLHDRVREGLTTITAFAADRPARNMAQMDAAGREA